MRLTASLDPVPHPGTDPLTSTRALGDCYVAGARLRKFQEAAIAEAGLEWVESGGAIRLRETAWVDAGGLQLLLSAQPPNLVRGHDLLAYPAAGGTDGVDVGQGGFSIKYSWDFLTLQEILLGQLTESRIEGALDERATLDGVLVLGQGSKVLPGVHFEGVTVIGCNCTIGPNAYLRGKTMIGDHCHVGQAVEIKNSILYPETKIGHLSYCGDSVIGQGVNFGAGTIVANFRHDGKNHRSLVGEELVDTGRRKFGAIIGDGVHTGIHTSVYPGRKIWPEATTRPGEIVGKDLRCS